MTIGSANSLVARAGAAAYVASKGGLLQLTRALAVELAPSGVRANCVCPGNIDTPLTDRLRRCGRTIRPARGRHMLRTLR